MKLNGKKLLRDAFIFYFIGVTYVFIEVLWRGCSHYSMFILAGICAMFMDKLNNKFSYNMDLLLQCILSTIVCVLLEGCFGVIFNIWLGLNVWDYSALTTPTFFWGQVSLVYSFAWFLLSIICIMVCDAINYYIFNLYGRPHYKLFGKTIIEFPWKWM